VRLVVSPIRAQVRPAHHGHRSLIAGWSFVLAVRLAFYAWRPNHPQDSDQLYYAAIHLLRGENPYPIIHQWFPWPLYCPLPAILLSVPFTLLPVGISHVVWDVAIGWAFAWALWQTSGSAGLLCLASGAYLFAMRSGQTTPLLVAASLIPTAGFLLTVKPNVGVALGLARWRFQPPRLAIGSAAAILMLSFLILPRWILPRWPVDWWVAFHQRSAHLRPPILRPYGWLLLAALLRWRTAEGRLLFLLACIPQNPLPHELVPLALIPRRHVESAVYVAGTWVVLLVAAVGSTPLTRWLAWPR